MRYPYYIEKEYAFPPFHRVVMAPPSRALADPVASLKEKLLPGLERIGVLRGQTVAVGVGSRGIQGIDRLVAGICEAIRQKGAVPWIIPAMGSHGAATAQGQKDVLARLGITQETCNAPVFSEMTVTQIDQVLDGVPVYFSQKALEADHSICINRIKPHTKFKGAVESGLFKMMVVGLGKHEGALVYHNMALKHGFYSLLKEMGKAVVRSSNLGLGIGVVEDAQDQTMAVEVIQADKIEAEEPGLLELARLNFPKLPFDALDVLVVCRIGKEISGSGMDPNVTGRTYDFMEDDFSACLDVKRVAILDLSDHTHGNAIGLGNADIITEKVFQKMDYEATLMNALTSMSLRKAHIPVRLPTECKAIQAAFTTIGPISAEQIRAVILQDTLHTATFWVSPALVQEAGAIPHARVTGQSQLEFSPEGNLKKEMLF